ncbi:sensor histidine kinase [Pedobacter boryungensis]|uniref:histidine kinase n=1 Tax=Pedobacter boryungensis TaxID=869962 RepID=A0ABX2DFP3_9SPHI|nr:HAMP domain-containing sensor histidine kinase [Pedobacter boryungensis]NQX32303.1 HAMP domain-containing histidine kinase [Pedobacter boryungensis]
MRQKHQLLPALCFTAMLILLGLQVYWISKYYNITKQNFEKEVNLVFEDAFKKEFSLRADSIQNILKRKLLDTALFTITSRLDKKDKRVIYTVGETKNPKDKFSSSFSLHDVNTMIKEENKKQMTTLIAQRFSELLRNEDLNNHIIYYRTQELGKYMLDLTNKMEFDTANLRPILNKYLANKSIFVKYNFYAKRKDSTTNSSTFKQSLLKKYPIITHSLPTYNHNPGQNYIRVLFKDPFPYILSNMWLILFSSIFLVLLIAFCLYYLLKSLRKEKKLSAIKNDFISNITHEFKTPLATSMLAIEALNQQAVRDDEEKATRYLKHAKNELNRISELTDKILKISLYDTGIDEIKKEKIQIEIIINEIIDIYSLTAKKVKITLNNNTGIVEILADKSQFQHAIANVIDNAIKYGRDEIEIDITLLLESDYFVTVIKDNGPGIDKSDMPFVFEKFYRAKQHHVQSVKGYGLGLNYVKQIMEQHKGWYSLQSNQHGTELKLGWPL